MGNRLLSETKLEIRAAHTVSKHEVCDKGGEENGDKPKKQLVLPEQDEVANASDHAKTGLLGDGADNESRSEGNSYRGVLRAGTGALRGEQDERRRRHKQGNEPQLDYRPDNALGNGKAVRPLKREAFVQEVGADEDAAHKAGKADDGVEVASGDTQYHAERAAEEHEGTDHDAEP